jgi:hypothetical protein
MSAVLDQLTITTQKVYDDSVFNNELLSQESAALRMLQENKVIKGGRAIDVKVRKSRLNGGFYPATGAVFDTQKIEVLGEGVLQWPFAYTNITIEESEIVKNADMDLNTLMSYKDLKSVPKNAQETIINLANVQFKAAIEDLKHIQATQLFSTSVGADEAESLPNIINTSTSYAGIAANEFGTFDYVGSSSGLNDNIWAGRVNHNSGANRSLTLEILQKVCDDCSMGSNGPKWGFCGRRAYSALSLLLEGTKRRDAYAEEIGFYAHMKWPDYDVTFYRDEYCDTNEIYLINPKHLKMYVHKGLPYVFSGFVRPHNEPRVAGQLKVAYQIWCDDRAKNGLIDDAQP